MYLNVPRNLALNQGCGRDSAPPAVEQTTASAASDPKFDWFKYEGNDPVYQHLSVGENEFINPINAGFYPDPSIVRVEDDYYMVYSSFIYFAGTVIAMYAYEDNKY
ncbi:family 43 glycosylhydrolase [Aliifodinibius salicampi]|uniref:Family 43 glycosylhydrolase n=1 Tax=Fodinibius salicampi TaxID=1920655 RepID=A0ABT3PUI1_9BACT|nr:family 43 glycosylhydrolase [Fodinibius salicampi]MCW9711496.1 family 43 glycosylhydrolase [Fodinibius salicampi]